VKDAASIGNERRTLTRERGGALDESSREVDEGNRPSKAGYADFFARVAHDLRSPLGIVMHVLQRLEADLAIQLTDDHKALAKLGGRGVRRLQTFVERVALLAELENDELVVNLQPVDLGQLARRAVEANGANEPRSGVEVSYQEPEERCRVIADPALVSRILSELLTNAVGHARRIVRVGVLVDSSSASVFVEDDGAGVTENARATLYHRFVVHDARGGLGIGLSIVSDLVRVQSGEIRLEPSTLPPGRPGTVGARFVLSLPRAAVTHGLAHD